MFSGIVVLANQEVLSWRRSLNTEVLIVLMIGSAHIHAENAIAFSS
jgi:hypothetical protein